MLITKDLKIIEEINFLRKENRGQKVRIEELTRALNEKNRQTENDPFPASRWMTAGEIKRVLKLDESSYELAKLLSKYCNRKGYPVKSRRLKRNKQKTVKLFKIDAAKEWLTSKP